ncbi:MAG: Rossman fold protein, TIGR00730 family, partial [Myxococcales bacterium]
MTVQRICVFTGSSPGERVAYADAAKVLAEEIVRRDFELVYGGANVGLMGVVADRVLELGGRAIGVIPESLVKWEVAH